MQAVALTLQRLGLAGLIAAMPCRERELVLAMVGVRILAPHTKLATTRWWHTTTLAEERRASSYLSRRQAAGGCSVLLTEDMQDGELIAGVKLVNPFAA